MTHWQLKDRLLCIKLGSDTLEPVWAMITIGTLSSACIYAIHLSIKHLLDFMETCFLWHTYMCMCVLMCAIQLLISSIR